MSKTCPAVAGLSRQPDQVGQDAADRDRLGAIGDPAWADHRGQPGDQRTKHLERSAARSDDHGRAKFRGGHGTASKHVSHLVAARQMLRQSLGSPAQAAEVDDSLEAGRRGGRSEVARGQKVALAEQPLATGHRVNQVISSTTARQGRVERVAVKHVARDDLDLGLPVTTAKPVRVADQAADAMPLGQQAAARAGHRCSRWHR